VLVLKSHAQPGGDVRVFDLATRASGKLPAERSLKVGEFLDHHLGIRRPEGLAIGEGTVAGFRRHHRADRL
jgi:hypothetical protein